MIPHLTVPVETCYRRPYVPKRCTVERVEYPLMKEFGAVSQIDREEALVAFRLHYPLAALTVEERTVDILLWRKKLWWPHGETIVCRTGVVVGIGVDDWCESISADRDLTRILPVGASTVNAELFSRLDLLDGQDHALMEVKRGLAENFMICDDEVYAAGGVPVLARWHYDGCRRITIVGTGTNREILQPGKPLVPQVGFLRDGSHRTRVRRGRRLAPGSEGLGKSAPRPLTRNRGPGARPRAAPPRRPYPDRCDLSRVQTESRLVDLPF